MSTVYEQQNLEASDDINAYEKITPTRGEYGINQWGENTQNKEG